MKETTVKNVNKKEITTKIKGLIEQYGSEIPATKISMANIIMPNLTERGSIMTAMFCNVVKTKEQPTGCLYDSDMYPILRVINGKLYNDKKELDCYCWTAQDYDSKKSKLVPIGLGSNVSDEANTWAYEVLNGMKLESEKEELKEFLTKESNLQLVFSKKEHRTVTEVTEKLYNRGLTMIVDNWMQTDDNGIASTTELNIGDFIIHDGEGFYCIRRDEFLATHII